MPSVFEEFKVQSRDLADKIKGFIDQGNVQRIVIKDDKGNTFLEIPLSLAAISVVAAPVIAGVRALANKVAHFTVVVERTEEHPPDKPQ